MESENSIGETQQPVVPASPVATASRVNEKRKSRRPSKGQVPKRIKQEVPKRIKQEDEDEDVCFVCLNGGDLVLCDRKCCPKAYHLGCIQKDEKFLSSKKRWICGWHLCTACLKTAHYMCYTCNYSFCKPCVKNAEYVCVRENYGFCGTCLKTIMLIENQDAGSNEMVQVDFDDQGSWEYLFKVYWILVKNKLSLTLNELKQGRNTWNALVGSDFLPQLSEDGAVSTLLKSHEHSKPEIVLQASLGTESCDKSTVVDGYADWGSRELLEFVSHIRKGDTTVMSQLDVRLLLLEYIKSNNLHDPHQKSQIICDERLKNLFGKPYVGHMDMLKLLDCHLMKKENIQKKAGLHPGADECKGPVLSRNNLSKTSKKDEDRTPQTNFDDYAAIDVHNISLIFLRRSIIESILGEVENFHDQVVGSIVRISVSNDGKKPGMHRLVQVVGTSKGAETYKVGNKTTDIMLEVLNLTKKESMPIDAISDQDFSEDECKRLHQGIKFGLMKRLAVEEIQSKAVALQALKFHDWLAAEILRLNRIRNQAKEKGCQKEVIECTEKLKILKTPEESQRRLSAIPEVHADPKMNPCYESEDEDEDKADEPMSDQGLHENENGCVSNTCDKQEDHANGSSVLENQAMLSSASDTAMVDSPSINTIGTEDFWHYRDPNDKIQGPFSMKHLRFWSTTGYFPAGMKIWNDNEQESSILLSDALIGKFQKVSQLLHSNMSMESSEEARNDVDNKMHVSLNFDLNSKDFNAASSTNPQKSSEQSCDSNVLDLPSPNPETGTGNLEIPFTEHHESVVLEIRADDMKSSITKDIGISDLPSSPRPKTLDDNLIAAREQNEPSEIPVEDSGLSREPESSKTSMSSSLQVSEMVTTNPVATPNSNQNVSCWQAINERIEFSTLADESVSDLLAEIDAMEFENSSPTRDATNDMVDRNDCFSFIEDPRKSDALSSTADFPFRTLEAVMDDLFGKSDAFNPPSKSSGEHSTTSSSSYLHPSPPSTMNHQAVVSENMAHDKGPETMNHGFEAGTPQALTNMETSWENPNFNFGVDNGNVNWDDERIYGGETFLGSSDMDTGFGSNRQFHGGGDGGGGGGYSSQRVCKYYQYGHCKKGAS